MAGYTNVGTGLASVAATWNKWLTPTNFAAATAISVGTTPQYTTTFTAPNTTNAVTGLTVYISSKGSASSLGDITFQLQDHCNTTPADIAGVVITINVIDIYNNTAGADLMQFRLASPYVFTATTAGYYRWKMVRSSTGGTLSFGADATSLTSIAHMTTDDETGVPVSGDRVRIQGINADATVYTVTLDGDQTWGDRTSTSTPSTAARSSANLEDVIVGDYGELLWDTAASASLTCRGNFVATYNSRVTCGTQASPYPTGKLAQLIFSMAVSGGHMIYEYPTALVNFWGEIKGTGGLWKANYVSGVGTAGSPLVVNANVGWAAGDQLCVGPSSNDAANFSQTDYATINTVVAPDTYVLDNPLENIVNGGFETLGAGGADVFANMTEFASGGTIVADTVSPDTGTYCAKITYVSGASSSIYSLINVIAGQSYTLTMRCRGDGTRQGRFNVYDVTNASDSTITTSMGTGTIVTGVTAAAYSTVTVTFTIPTNCASIRIYMYGPTGAGSVYFDNISLISDTPILTKTTDAMVYNITRNVVIKSDDVAKGWARTTQQSSTTGSNYKWIRTEQAGSAVSGHTSFLLGHSSVTATYTNCDYSVAYAPVGTAWGYNVTTTPNSNTDLLVCRGTLSTSAGISLSGIKNQTLTNFCALDMRRLGITFLGSAANNFLVTPYIAGCNRDNVTASGGLNFSSGIGNIITNPEIHCNGYCGIYASSNAISTTVKGGHLGTKGYNGLYDIWTVADSYNTILFDTGYFGSPTLIGQYALQLAGSRINFKNLNGTAYKHRSYTPGGSSRASGPGLTDTTVRTTGNYAHAIYAEDATDGAIEEYKVVAKSNTSVSASLFLWGNAAFVAAGDASILVELFLPGSTTADATKTMTKTTDAFSADASCQLSAYYSGTEDSYATIRVTVKTATASAYAYVADFFNGSNEITGFKVWDKGQPSPIMFEQLGDANAVWAVLTSTQTTAGTMGEILSDALTLTDFVGLK